MTCGTCRQPIQPSEKFETYHVEGDRITLHESVKSCIAATEAATARKCYGLAVGVKKRCCTFLGRLGAESVVDAIATAFPDAFAQKEKT